MTRVVDAVLQADGWVTTVSPPGADGGVDILAGRGSLGLDAPRLCVQVKSQDSPADVTVYRTLQGAMQTFKVEQGCLFVGAVLTGRLGRNRDRGTLWCVCGKDVILWRPYIKSMSAFRRRIQAELPLKRVVDACSGGFCRMTVLNSYPAYKPSGAEWLGDVPANWEVSTLRRRLRTMAELKSVLSAAN